MATKEARVEFFKTRPEHKPQVGGAAYVCRHIAEKLKNGAAVVESKIMSGRLPGEFAGVCSQCAESIWSKQPPQ